MLSTNWERLYLFNKLFELGERAGHYRHALQHNGVTDTLLDLYEQAEKERMLYANIIRHAGTMQKYVGWAKTEFRKRREGKARIWGLSYMKEYGPSKLDIC